MAAPHTDSMIALVGRLFWMALGPAGLLIGLAMILMSPGTGWLTAADLTYLAVLAGMVYGRYVEHKWGSPRNSMGEPSSSEELRSYVLVTLLVGTGAWAAVNLISNYALA